MVAERVPQPVVAGGAAEALDVLMLVQCRDALRGQLPAHPVGLLDQADALSPPRRRQGRGHTAGAAAYDQYVAGDLRRLIEALDPDQRRGRIATHRHPHDVDQRVELRFGDGHGHPSFRLSAGPRLGVKRCWMQRNR